MIRLNGRVAIVTGAGGGLGRAHAHLLAARGARVVVNDVGAAAEQVVQEIVSEGGEAIAAVGSVTDEDFVLQMAADAKQRWGQLDILVNNAGILRDKTFAKMDLADFRTVLDVHVMGAVNCTKAVWETMREQRYGRIVMTTSSSGLFGNFGQSNYGAAKMALVGLMQTLGLEGEKYDIKVNCLAPTAATQMMEGVLPEQQLRLLRPEYVSPAMLALVREGAPTRTILCAGAKGVEAAHISMTQGIHIADEDQMPEAIVSNWDQILDAGNAFIPNNALEQSRLELAKAGYVPGDAP
ncbi:SDR family NAD(P)-dependent oxidoreductase [uncultured Hyphomonas sp.]|jgi:NAD(P)-dependent dehydrogenase (short-subunit alcohol dehydrogenase family)|uniref:SDR family NAD(P)-dependent oxidoreductase n=1 Tax=uncultured Hyphomonas sp. TaxID=225298 RepID=UPI000C426CDD|nr:3-hydroxyacyl-CoA dehydrogenase [Hyphomonadaceae bacterium]|tara:strand:- start:2174 stop:3058 length:885 start_codon:yes stop_codon:yes gene_type:complete